MAFQIFWKIPFMSLRSGTLYTVNIYKDGTLPSGYPLTLKGPKKMDPYINPINEFFACEYQKIFNTKPYLLNNQRNKLIELASEIDDFAIQTPPPSSPPSCGGCSAYGRRKRGKNIHGEAETSLFFCRGMTLIVPRRRACARRIVPRPLFCCDSAHPVAPREPFACEFV